MVFNGIPFSLALLSFCIFSVFLVLFLVLPLCGHVLTIGSIRPTCSLQNVRFVRAKLYSISASSIQFLLHVPNSREPFWAKLFVQDYYYRDLKCDVSIAKIEITLWFFPMLFRFTAGPLLTVKFDDFRLRVYNSEYTPRWVRELRDNLIYTAINEETVRLHQFMPRFVLSGLISMTGYNRDTDEVEKPGLEANQGLDEVKIQGKVQQWHIHNARNNRMYTFDTMEMELRDSWVEGRESLVLITHDSKWTKLPLVGQISDESLLRYFGRTLAQAPIELMKMINDPMSVVNMDVSRCDITFKRFHLKDSALVKQGSVLVKQKYEKSKDHGVLSEACIDKFVQALVSVYDQREE
ncbi:hypothetical protein NP233_g7196 [Leucocoprinus birnbaumii]|uniref:Uncharacterized protein n=1 Tax=Leucocoprinus birnbaumii TaxID=56174 RepID=A0AAD5VPQ6_9AGAR|nr:hypothetical protein NP233_g7196 [Leucocoprinus birnbaumii]